MRKSPFHLSGMAKAKVIPNSSPTIPVRRFTTPSTRQYAGKGAVPSRVPGNSLGGSGSNGGRFGDFNILGFEVCQFRAGFGSCAQGTTGRDKPPKACF
jgi:hypothetical protein